MHIKQVQSKREELFSVSYTTLLFAYPYTMESEECIKQLFRRELYLPNQSEAVRLGVRVALVLQ